MPRCAVRLLLTAILAAAVLFHSDVVVEGQEAPVRHWCGACTLDIHKVSRINKELEFGDIAKNTENVCREMQVVDDHELIFQDEKGQHCNADCWSIVKSAWLEVMKHDNVIVDFIKDMKPSIQKLKEFVCNQSPSSAQGDDDDEDDDDDYNHDDDDYEENKWIIRIKKYGSNVKQIINSIPKLKFWQTTEKPTILTKACKNCSKACRVI